MEQLLVITDPGQDQDDEVMLILLASLLRSGEIKKAAVVANLAPSFTRAQLAKGTLEKLGVDVPVAYGESVVSEIPKNTSSLDRISYLSEAEKILIGQQLMLEVLSKSARNSVTVLVVAGMTDLAMFLKSNKILFKEKVSRVVMMSGIKEVNYSSLQPSEHFLTPDSASNNKVDFSAAVFCYSAIQELEIQMTILSRFAAYGCKFDKSLFDEMAETNHPVGLKLRNSLKERLEQLWSRACLPANHPDRKGLPSRCDTSWFLSTFCDAKEEEHSFESVWPTIKWINLYDPLTLIASESQLLQKFFNPFTISIQNVMHQVIGVNSFQTGIKDRVELKTFVRNKLIEQLEVSIER